MQSEDFLPIGERDGFALYKKVVLQRCEEFPGLEASDEVLLRRWSEQPLLTKQWYRRQANDYEKPLTLTPTEQSWEHNGNSPPSMIHDDHFATHDDPFAIHDDHFATHDDPYATHDDPYATHDDPFATHDDPYATPEAIEERNKRILEVAMEMMLSPNIDLEPLQLFEGDASVDETLLPNNEDKENCSPVLPLAIAVEGSDVSPSTSEKENSIYAISPISIRSLASHSSTESDDESGFPTHIEENCSEPGASREGKDGTAAKRSSLDAAGDDHGLWMEVGDVNDGKEAGHGAGSSLPAFSVAFSCIGDNNERETLSAYPSFLRDVYESMVKLKQSSPVSDKDDSPSRKQLKLELPSIPTEAKKIRNGSDQFARRQSSPIENTTSFEMSRSSGESDISFRSNRALRKRRAANKHAKPRNISVSSNRSSSSNKTDIEKEIFMSALSLGSASSTDEDGFPITATSLDSEKEVEEGI